MAVIVRKMKVEDISDVKRADLISWSELIERDYPLRVRVECRTDENILSYLHSDPDGAFVAADEFAGIIGSSFSHVWGKTGWVGPLSVLPSYQGKGVGKELLKSSLRYLEDQGCSDIGLETMPESEVNLGMYFKVGLKPEGMVLILAKKLDENEPPDENFGDVSVERLSDSEVKNHVMAQIRRISNSLHPGLDYSGEVELTEKFSFGDTLVAAHKGKVVGFCVTHTVARRENMRGAAIRVMATDPSVKDNIVEPLIASAELMAMDSKANELSLPIPGLTRRGMDIAFSRGYSVIQSFARLMWIGSSGITEKNTNLSSWSG